MKRVQMSARLVIMTYKRGGGGGGREGLQVWVISRFSRSES